MLKWFYKNQEEEEEKKEKEKEKENEKETEPNVSATPPICRHKWRDFNWYIESEWKSDFDSDSSPISFTTKIIEPYVCCLCKKRENHVLHKTSMNHVPQEKLDQIIEEWKTEYKDHIRGRAVIEDEIADMQNTIDREYLEIIATLYPEKLGLTKEQKEILHLGCIGD